MKSLGKQKAELNETRQFNFDFWKSFIENQATKVPEVKGRTPGKDHFLGVKTGFGGLTFTFLVSKKYYGVELYIDLNDEQKNRLVLDYLTGKKKEIEAGYPGFS